MVLKDPPYYDVAISKLDSYFEPMKRRTYERQLFRQIVQKPSERLIDFVLRLRKQVKRCQYDKPEEMIIDQIAEKCYSNKLKEKMYRSDMTLEEIEAFGTSLEETDRKLKETCVSSVPETVQRVVHLSSRQSQSNAYNKSGEKFNSQRFFRQNSQAGPKPSYASNENQRYLVDRNRQTSSLPVCFACGKRGHVKGAEICPAIDAICRRCNQKGHFYRQCRKRVNSVQSNAVPTKRIRAVLDETEENTERESNYVFYAMGNNTFLFSVGGVQIPMVIDSGAAANIIAESTWELMKKQDVAVWNMTTTIDRDFKSYASDEPMQMLGKFSTHIEAGDRKAEAVFYVARNGQQCLLGDQTAKELNVLKVGFDLNNVSAEPKHEFPKFKGVVVEIPVDPTVQPVHRAIAVHPMLWKIKCAINCRSYWLKV